MKVITSDVSGNWNVKVSTPVAGGPYSVNISMDKKHQIVLYNAMIHPLVTYSIRSQTGEVNGKVSSISELYKTASGNDGVDMGGIA